jgi:hypothetical protein
MNRVRTDILEIAYEEGNFSRAVIAVFYWQTLAIFPTVRVRNELPQRCSIFFTKAFSRNSASHRFAFECALETGAFIRRELARNRKVEIKRDRSAEILRAAESAALRMTRAS